MQEEDYITRARGSKEAREHSSKAIQEGTVASVHCSSPYVPYLPAQGKDTRAVLVLHTWLHLKSWRTRREEPCAGPTPTPKPTRACTAGINSHPPAPQLTTNTHLHHSLLPTPNCTTAYYQHPTAPQLTTHTHTCSASMTLRWGPFAVHAWGTPSGRAHHPHPHPNPNPPAPHLTTHTHLQRVHDYALGARHPHPHPHPPAPHVTTHTHTHTHTHLHHM